MSKSAQTATAERLAIPASEVAKLLNISERHVWALNSSGRLPRPIRLGRRVLWSRAEIAAWIEAGAPTRDRWEQIKQPAMARGNE